MSAVPPKAEIACAMKLLIMHSGAMPRLRGDGGTIFPSAAGLHSIGRAKARTPLHVKSMAAKGSGALNPIGM